LPYLPHQAKADAAVAVGVPSSVKKAGYAYGRTTNSADMQTASDHALNNCRTAKDASPEAKNLCYVVMTFRNQCIALALDPAGRNPGGGLGGGADPRRGGSCRRWRNASRPPAPDRRDACKISGLGLRRAVAAAIAMVARCAIIGG